MPRVTEVIPVGLNTVGPRNHARQLGRVHASEIEAAILGAARRVLLSISLESVPQRRQQLDLVHRPVRTTAQHLADTIGPALYPAQRGIVLLERHGVMIGGISFLR